MPMVNAVLRHGPQPKAQHSDIVAELFSALRVLNGRDQEDRSEQDSQLPGGERLSVRNISSSSIYKTVFSNTVLRTEERLNS